MKLLLILYNYYTDDMPSWPEIMSIYGHNIPEMGHKVDWILPYKTESVSRIILTKYRSANIYLIPFIKNNNILLKGISYIFYYLRLFYFLIKKGKEYDIIQVRDDVFSSMLAIIVSSVYRRPFVFNYSFPFYQGALDVQKLSKKRFSLYLLYWKVYDIILRNIVFKKADYLLPISEEMVEELCRGGLKKDKMHPIPLGIEPEIFKLNEDRIITREKLGFKENDFIFIQVGSLNKARGLDIIIRAFFKAVKKTSNIKLLFLGNGDNVNALKELVSSCNLDNSVRFMGNVKYSLVPEYIDISDGSLSIINPLKCYYVCSPCKLFEYLFIGCPVIANEEIPEHRRVIQESKGGLFVKYEENSIAEGMAKLAEIYRTNPIKYREMVASGRTWVINNRSFKDMSAEMEKIYLRLLNNK